MRKAIEVIVWCGVLFIGGLGEEEKSDVQADYWGSNFTPYVLAC